MIEVKNISMNYGSVRALEGVSFTAREGQVLGLLGPNGAGKTTAMNIIAGHLFPVAGTVTVGGHDVLENPVEARKLVGYLPEREPLYPDMEVAELLRFVGKARGLRGNALKKRTQWVLDACGLRPVYRRPVSDLSRGYRQRAGLAQALIHDPPVLILDELTSGLDPLQTQGIRKLVRELAKDGKGSGKCIIFSTHVMQEAQAVSDRIVIINHGRIVAEGEPDEIKGKVSTETATLVTVEGTREEVEEALRAVRSAGEVEFVGQQENLVSFRIRSGSTEILWQELATVIRRQGWLVKELTPTRPSLEDAFLTLTRAGESPGGAAPEGVVKEERAGDDPGPAGGEVAP